MVTSSASHNGNKKPQNTDHSEMNVEINPPHIKPRKEVVIGVAAQDVQISGSMTRLHGCRR